MRTFPLISSLFWAAPAALVFLGGCTSGKKTTAETVTPTPAVTAEAEGACLPPDPHEESDLLAPVKVTVEPGPNVDLKAGEVDLVIRVSAKAALPYPLSLQVAPSVGGPNAALAQAEPLPSHNENLHFSCRSNLTRTVHVHAPGPITPETPARVVVQGQSADGSVGVHVRKQFPAATEMTAPPSQGAPPGGRPPTRKPRPLPFPLSH